MDTNSRTRGYLERSPHDQIHFAIGGGISFGTTEDPDDTTAGLMSSVQTAAFDPMFWIHHCNVERLWTLWDCLKDRKWGNTPVNAWFFEKPWWFNDHDGTVVNETRLHYLSDDLGTRYDSDPSTCKPFSRTPPVKEVVAAVASARLSARKLMTIRAVETLRQEIGRNVAQVTLSPEIATYQSVTFGARQPRGGALKSMLTASAPSARRRVLLEIDDIDYRQAPSVGYNVYVNLPKNVQPDPESANFVGTLVLFGIKHGTRDHANMSSTQQFDITPLVNQSADPSGISVVVVPFDLLVPAKDVKPLRRQSGVTIGTMRVVVVEAQKPSLQ